MVGLSTTVTPPHPPPNPKETVPSTHLEVILKQRLGPLLVKTISWGFALAEVAVIVASNFEKWELSKLILSKLVFSGRPGNIRMTKWLVIGTSLATIGGYIRWECYCALGHLFTFEMSIRDDHRLVTDGPYAWVRHPGYTSVLSTFVGLGIWHATKGSYARECGALNSYVGRGAALINISIVITIISGLLTRMSKEDDALRKRFGKKWEEWAERVPYKLIPWMY